MAIARCSQGHANDSAASECAICGQSLPQPQRSPDAGGAPAEEGGTAGEATPAEGPTARRRPLFVRRWRRLSGTARTALAAAVAAAVALAVVLVVVSPGTKTDSGKGGGAATAAPGTREASPAATTPAPA